METLTALWMSIPPLLAGGWGLWFAAGLGLSIWGRYEKNKVWNQMPEVEAPMPIAAQRHARAQAKAPHSAGDAFGELQALLEEQQSGSHRMPGEAPAAVSLSAAAAQESPVLNEAPRLAAPQSLP